MLITSAVGVVVRQEGDALEEDDHWVVIPVQDAEYVAHAIIRKANEIKAEWKDGKPESEEEREPRLALPAPGIKASRTEPAKRGVA